MNIDIVEGYSPVSDQVFKRASKEIEVDRGNRGIQGQGQLFFRSVGAKNRKALEGRIPSPLPV